MSAIVQNNMCPSIMVRWYSLKQHICDFHLFYTENIKFECGKCQQQFSTTNGYRHFLIGVAIDRFSSIRMTEEGHPITILLLER